MRTIQQYRERRQTQQALGKFHIGHFPVGTVVEVEDPTNGFISDESQRNHPDEAYQRKTVTVVGVINNGPDSWLIKLLEWHELIEDFQSINIAWVRKIVSRGTGKLSADDQLKADKFSARVAQFHQNRNFNVYCNKTLATDPAPGNCYGLYGLGDFLHDYINYHPQYQVVNGQHLIDIDKLRRLVLKALPEFSEDRYYQLKSINKKRFARVVKAAYAKSKTSRRKAGAEEERLNMEQYEREMAREWEHDYS